MCAQDGIGSGGEEKEKGEMLLQEEQSTESARTETDGLPRTTTGVIRIMRAKGREEAAALVEELHETKEKVVETTRRAQKLLALLRTLHKKTTGTFPTIPPRASEEEA